MGHQSKTQEQIERNALLDACEKLSIKEGFHGTVEVYPFSDEKSLSLEDRLSLAIMLGSVETVERMLELGADPNAKSFQGRSLLHLAEVHGREDLIPLLKSYELHADLPTKPVSRKK